MTIKESQRQLAIDLIARHFLKFGLAKSSLRQLAAAAKVSDRMLLYYFKNKNEIIFEVMTRLAAQLSDMLDQAIPAQKKVSVSEMILITTRLTQSKEFSPHMRLWLEIAAQAVRNKRHFVEIANQIAGGFITWIEGHLDIESRTERKEAAAMILAMVDGLALLEACTDEVTARKAAKRMARSL